MACQAVLTVSHQKRYDVLYSSSIILAISISVCVGFINPGSLTDRLPRKGSAQADNTQLMGRPKSLNNRLEGRYSHQPEGLAGEEQHPLVDSSPPLRPERSLRSLATSGRSLRPKDLAKHYLRL